MPTKDHHAMLKSTTRALLAALMLLAVLATGCQPGEEGEVTDPTADQTVDEAQTDDTEIGPEDGGDAGGGAGFEGESPVPGEPPP